ncbi:heavy metal translocating P-type ATPase [Roseospira visakhapatnamensis]|uniref:P-type Zn(2+) transporter n=1 Tax=Roseospira visakhapatnamensis TaxID=390880 RepID=A0A7W6W888_9PROT|nr:heavy metal translocating P-type ATPase [Roseospira visakhapatnamensis]MBB4264589.1 Cu2+-exporting ATPase [Roseospira visakhapatnamensis]
MASIIAVVVSVAGIVQPAIAIAALPFVLWGCFPFLQDGVVDLVRRRRITFGLIDTVVFVSLILSGQWLIAALLMLALSASGTVLARAENRSQQVLMDGLGVNITKAWLLIDGAEVETPLDRVDKGATVVVRAGGTIPVDGLITEGCGTVDERLLTGEALPVERTVGERVYASTHLLTGTLSVCVEEAGTRTVAAQIAATLQRTLRYRQSLQWRWLRLLDRLTAPILIFGAVAWALRGTQAAMGVIWAFGFGYTMRLAAPAALFTALRRGLDHQILVKDGRTLERMKTIDTVVFDKTGTLTSDTMQVTDIDAFGDHTDADVLRLAASAEADQTHIIALAILEAARRDGLDAPRPDDVTVQFGFGLTARLAEGEVAVGSARFMETLTVARPALSEDRERESAQVGRSTVWIALDGQAIGAIHVQPTLRPEAHAAVRLLKRRNLTLHVLSGDQRAPTEHLARTLGIDRVQAETPPDQKAVYIQELQRKGHKVCFIGDGINDSIALSQADMSVSISGASSIAIDTSQVILLTQDIRGLHQIFDVAEGFNKRLTESLYLSIVADAALVIAALFGQAAFTTIVLGSFACGAAIVSNAARPPRPGDAIDPPAARPLMAGEGGPSALAAP